MDRTLDSIFMPLGYFLEANWSSVRPMNVRGAWPAFVVVPASSAASSALTASAVLSALVEPLAHTMPKPAGISTPEEASSVP